jgi:subtilase-type serine protease
VQGTGKIVIEDPSYVPMSNDNGPLTLHLSSRSTYSGGTEVKQGALAIAGETFLSNGVVESGPFGTGPVRMHAGVLRSGQGKRTLFNTVEVNGSFQLGYSNFNGIAVAGNIQLNGSHTITVAANTSGSVEVSGPISESTAGVGLTWNLQGDLELTSIANYTGPTVVKGAGLHLNAPGSLGASPLVLTSGAKLFGDGTTASILAETNTTISPGEGIGTLRTFGDARLESNSHLRFEIDSNQGGIGYDQWNLQGTVALIDADLQLLGAFQIHPADTFFLVLNDGNEPVSGTFTRLNGTVTNLAQGAVFVAASELFEISYTAEEGVGFTGSGNDIAIRAVPEPSTLTLLLLSLSTLTRHRKR